MSVKTKTALNTDIDTEITTNGKREIAGADLNTILGNMVDSYEDFVPSYTSAQIAAIASPVLRQRVFNTTDNDYEYYDGTRWVKEAHPKYKVYTALLTQTGTDAPVATVLENTLGGTVVWSYSATGQYNATLASAFTSAKTHLFINTQSANQAYYNAIFWGSENIVSVHTYQLNGGGGGANDAMIDVSIEIRVYY